MLSVVQLFKGGVSNVPKTIIARLTISLIFIMLVIAAAIYAVIVFRGEPKLLASQIHASEQSALAISRQLSSNLSEIEGRVASMAALGASLPSEKNLVEPALATIIDASGNRAISGGGLWPEAGAFTPGVVLDSLYWARSSQGQLEFSAENNAAGMEPYQASEWYKQGVDAAPGNLVGRMPTLTLCARC